MTLSSHTNGNFSLLFHQPSYPIPFANEISSFSSLLSSVAANIIEDRCRNLQKDTLTFHADRGDLLKVWLQPVDSTNRDLCYHLYRQIMNFKYPNTYTEQILFCCQKGHQGTSSNSHIQILPLKNLRGSAETVFNYWDQNFFFNYCSSVKGKLEVL